MSNVENDIQNVNQAFDDVLANFKTNYVNFHTNATLSLPTSPVPSSSDSDSTPKQVVSSNATMTKDPNDAALLSYRYAANQLLEKVRSQISLNSNQISSINRDINPIQKAYLNIMETGTKIDQAKSASELSLEDYNELYRTTVFGTMMYVVGAGLILYLLYKPKIQNIQ